MKLFNATRMAAGFALGVLPDGSERLVVALKGTYSIPKAGEEPVPACTQVPLVDADAFSGEPGFSSTVYECDFAYRKPKCDVLVNGSAHAPRGVPTDRVTVGLIGGPLRKSFDVVGERAWVKSVFSIIPTKPIAFRKKPVSYDVAFGGVDRAAEPHVFYAANHAGRGHYAHLDAKTIHGALLPCTEDPRDPVVHPKGKYRPMAFGAVGRAWEPRYRLAGTYDKKWLDEIFPFLPPDFNEEYFQSAPPDQRIPYPRGGEVLTLLNLTPEGRTDIRLPSAVVPVRATMRHGAYEETPVVDTIVIEPDLGRFTMTQRCSFPLKRGMHEVLEVVTGEPTRGWSRARMTNRIYYPSLREAIRAGGVLAAR